MSYVVVSSPLSPLSGPFPPLPRFGVVPGSLAGPVIPFIFTADFFSGRQLLMCSIAFCLLLHSPPSPSWLHFPLISSLSRPVTLSLHCSVHPCLPLPVLSSYSFSPVQAALLHTFTARLVSPTVLIPLFVAAMFPLSCLWGIPGEISMEALISVIRLPVCIFTLRPFLLLLPCVDLPLQSLFRSSVLL